MMYESYEHLQDKVTSIDKTGIKIFALLFLSNLFIFTTCEWMSLVFFAFLGWKRKMGEK